MASADDQAGVRILQPDAPWFARQAVAPGITRLWESGVVDFMQANIWLIHGRDRDLLVDTGNGIVPLRPALPELDTARTLVFATHAHADHSGGLHEWPGVICHRAVAEAIARADPDATLAGPGYGLCDLSGLVVGPPRLSGPLVRALPAGADPGWSGPKPARVARVVDDGDTLTLGDRTFRVMHLPGHSPGCAVLYDAAARLLVSGDVIYDDALVDDLHHSDRAAYRRSLSRLCELPVDLVLPGHGAAFDGVTLRRIARAWLSGWREGD